MKQFIYGLYIFFLVVCSEALVPDRSIVRQELILHKLSLSSESNHPFFREELTRRRVKRESSFPSDDEDIAYDFDGSGNFEDVPATESPTIPSTVVAEAPASSSTDWAWYRTSINFLDSVEYTSDLLDYHTEVFQVLAHEVMVDLEEHLKTELDGYLEATPLMFSMKDDDVFVLVDIGMCMTYTIHDVTRAILSFVSSGTIGRFRVSEDGFRIRQIGVDTQRRECKPGPTLPPPSTEKTTTPSTSSKETESNFSPLSTTTTRSTEPAPLVCRPDQATCSNLHCIDRSYVCDGTPDCFDGSDEPESCAGFGESACAQKIGDFPVVDNRKSQMSWCVPNKNADKNRLRGYIVIESQCDPTEFLCVGTGICAQKIWRCDGDNDCGNNYDELFCPSTQPGSRCLATQFECNNQVCISRSYHCDGESDCDDNSDEIGCTPPVVIIPPQRFINATEGATVTITCEAVGVPDPIISWRINWGNVPPPPRVTMTSENGRGTLTIRKVKPSDQGAYTCEALNPNGSILGTPDAIVIVDDSTPTGPPTQKPVEPSSPCPSDEFNASPNVSTLCRPCYCFGITDQCISSRLEYKEIGIEFTEPFDDQGVTLEPTDLIDGSPDIDKPITENQIRVNPPARELQLIDLSKRFLAAAHYWSLPAQFVGVKINSYGGNLTYSFSYNNSFHMDSVPTSHADLILEGKKKTLLFKNKGGHPGPVHKNKVEAVLDETDNWISPENVPATREDFLDVLSNLDRILIRTVYDKSMLSTGISDVTLQVAGHPNSSGSVISETQKIAYNIEVCDCPEGYEGLSCQECSPGYERITSGSQIGSCVSEEQGDSPSGICDPGYTGPGCTECAPGYVRHQGRCKLDTGHECDSAGTAEVDLDRECECKDTTQGRYCDQCKPGYYYLSERNQNGCLPCLCMGVTKNCASSSWNYTKIYHSSNDDSTLAITSVNVRPIYSNLVEYEPPQRDSNQLVAVAQLNGLPNDIYYWRLPEKFTGNKLTSYGGYLDYIIYYSVGSDAVPLTRVADVTIIGEEANLVHISTVPSHPNRDIRHVVALKEGYWRDDSGQVVSRQQLLLVLSNVKHLLIRASYTKNMDMSKISHIRLDEAVERQTGGAPALALEHCICPPGYTGLSCEECTTGFYRVRGGSFLGTCQPCECNGHATRCDNETGRCLNCQDNTIGDHCEICAPGYYGNALTGQPQTCLRCPCPPVEGRSDQWDIGMCTMNIDQEPVCDRCPTGFTGNTCESCVTGYERDPLDASRCRKRISPACECDPVGSVHGNCDETGQCICKASTTGKKCDQCKSGFFFMSIENPNGGCLPCFCMGVTDQCSSSHYKRNEVLADFSVNFGEFLLTERNVRNEISEGFEVLDNGRTLSYPRIDLLPREGSAYYWKLPEEYCGDKIVSFGGKLQYKITFSTYGRGTPIDEPDVILRGNDITLVSRMQQDDISNSRTVTFDKSILFKENHWLKPSGVSATREDLLLVLADLEFVLVRASYITTMLRTSISDVVMETASENMMMSEPLYEVEQCDCPDGYKGTSCEDCAAGFTRFEGGIYLGLCHLCQCNGHADLCDAESGTCFNCGDNTAGTHCNECAPGFYGDATLGTSNDCQPCACPGTSSNSFSETCRLDSSDNSLVCTACQEGYSGRRCEVCSPGFEGDPTAPGGQCVRVQNLLDVRVSPQTVEAREGDRVFLRCDVNSPAHVTINWRHSESNPESVPREAIMSNRGRTLLIPHLTRALAGTYECVATTRFDKKSDTAVISIQRERPMIEVRVEEPREMRARVGSQVTFVCTATSKMPAYLVTWTKQGGKLPMSRVTDFEGILHISNVQLSDSGTYICTGSNMYNIDRKTASLRVVGGDDSTMPEVEISPENQRVLEGSDARFYCTATGYPAPVVKWTRDDGRALSDKVYVDGNMLMIPSASFEDRSVYRCRASNIHGLVEATATLDVTARGEPPYVTVLTPNVQLTEGEIEELECATTGIPEPSMIWTKQDDELDENVELVGNTLRVTSATIANQGVYTCTSTNYFGQHYGQIRVTVKRKEEEGKPVCRTEPKNVTAYVGTNSTIKCVVGGNPLPEVTWEMENGFPLDSNIKVIEDKMYIVGVAASNAGKYVCVANNSKGVSRSNLILTVVEKNLPTIAISPNRFLTVKAGQDASFTCTAPGQNNVDITWLRSGKRLFTGETFLSQGNTKLNFRNVTSAEAGGYTCLAGNVVGYKQANVSLTVLEPPVMSVMPSRHVNVTEGNSLTLRCDAIGLPTPSVIWLNETGDGSPRMVTNYRLRSNSYTILDVRLWHGGRYICRAFNQAGSSHQAVVVKVKRKPSIPPAVTLAPPVVRGTAGSHVQIRCDASGYPKPDVTWSKGDGDLPQGVETEDNNFLHIYKLNSDSAGMYRCSATNARGSDTKTASVELIEPPLVRIEPKSEIFLVSGESVNVSCESVGGTQPISITWSKEPEFASLSNILHIIDFTPKRDSGSYTCTGANTAGSISLTLNLKNLDLPTISLSSNQTTKIVGQSMIFECAATDANGDVEITWQKANQSTYDSTRFARSSGSLRIDDIALEDRGLYECIATNKAGSSSAVVFLEVLIPPIVEIMLEMNSTVLKEGDSLTIWCNATGVPQPTVALSKDGVQLTTNENGKYLVQGVTLAQAGQYQCTAVNDAGNSTSASVVQVFRPPVTSIAAFENQLRSGDNLVLNCTAEGFPAPNITWSKLNGVLPFDAVNTVGVLKADSLLIENTGTYVCTATNAAGMSNSSTRLDVNAYLPYFTQTPLSYMVVYLRENYFYAEFNITISFRPITLNGLLLYSHSLNSDFLSISLADGVVEFRFDVGSGPVTIQSQSSVELDQWHTVKASRIHRNGQLQLDSNPAVKGKSPGEFRGLELSDYMYIGGIPNSISLPPSLQSLGSDSGFYGCISQLDLGLGLVDLGASRDVVERHGIVRCKTCSSDGDNFPCLNAATCIENHQNKTGYSCKCAIGFVGKNCQFNADDLCAADSCNGQGACAIDLDTELGFICTCYQHFAGPRCSIRVTTTTRAPMTAPRLIGPFARGRVLVRPVGTEFDLSSRDPPSTEVARGVNSANTSPPNSHSEAISFDQNSYAMNDDLRATGLKRTDISLRIRRRSRTDGLILYVGEFSRRSPFLSLGIRNNALEFRFNTGTDTAILRAPVSALGVGNWHTIRLVRRKSRGRLDVDGRTVAKARSSGPEDLFLEGPLFIGGVKFWDFVSEKLNIREGFTGCIESLQIDEVGYSINELFSKKNTGLCRLQNATSTTGSTEQILSEPSMPRYSARFTGTSYASFPRTSFDHLQEAEQISFRFKTSEPYGLIFYHGEDLVSELKALSRSRHKRRHRRRRARKKDYITLGVQGSKLVYSFDLGGGMGKATSRFPVSDGFIHSATIVRRGSLALMWLDDVPIPVATQSPRSHTVANTQGRIYIGGTPDVIFATAGRYTAGFNGCIKEVRLTPITSSRSSELGSGYLNDTSTTPLDFSPSGTLERINLRNCRNGY